MTMFTMFFYFFTLLFYLFIYFIWQHFLVCAGSMLLVLLMTMATASLSASFAVFLVRERANKSKHIQVHTACTLY